MKTASLRLLSVLAAAASLSGMMGLAHADEAKAGWTTNYQKALAQAKAENKNVLLDFTGSDWCSWCIKMDKDTLSQKQFTDYAAKNLVLVELDFPQQKQLSAETKKQNDELQKKFKAEGFPTFVLVNKDGKVLGQQEGYLEGGPSAFIAKLNAFKAGKAQ